MRTHRFVLADVYWTLAVACHVFLVLIYKYDAADLRKMEKKYIFIITALAAIPATILLFIQTQGKQLVYESDIVSLPYTFV